MTEEALADSCPTVDKGDAQLLVKVAVELRQDRGGSYFRVLSLLLLVLLVNEIVREKLRL